VSQLTSVGYFLTIENALHSEGGTVEIQSSSEGYYLYVSNTGIGIAPQHLKHIFERFWRADQSRSYGLEALD